jgi:hypothetical protein
MHDDPEKAVRFLRVYHKVIKKYLTGRYMKNPTTVKQLAKGLGVSVTTLKKGKPSVFDPSMSLAKANDDVLKPVSHLAHVQKTATFKGHIKAKDIVDRSFVKAALSCS